MWCLVYSKIRDQEEEADSTEEMEKRQPVRQWENQESRWLWKLSKKRRCCRKEGMVSLVRCCCEVKDEIEWKISYWILPGWMSLSILTILFQGSGGDENLTNVDWEKHCWKGSRDNVLDYRLLFKKCIGKLEWRSWVVDAIGHGVKQQLY